MLLAKLKGYMIKEFRQWSIAHFVFDTFLTLLITYSLALFSQLHWAELVILFFVVLGTVVSATWIYLRPRSVTFQDIQDFERGNESNRELLALLCAKSQIAQFADLAPIEVERPDHETQFRLWKTMLRSYLRGTCKEDIVDDFSQNSKSPKNAVATRMYLHGLINNLTRQDLRSSPPHPLTDPVVDVSKD